MADLQRTTKDQCLAMTKYLTQLTKMSADLAALLPPGNAVTPTEELLDHFLNCYYESSEDVTSGASMHKLFVAFGKKYLQEIENSELDACVSDKRKFYKLLKIRGYSFKIGGGQSMIIGLDLKPEPRISSPPNELLKRLSDTTKKRKEYDDATEPTQKKKEKKEVFVQDTDEE